jgi:hypothetical protein
MANYLMLSDLIGRADMLEIACGRCERRGRLSALLCRIHRLLERIGGIEPIDHARRGRPGQP